MCDSVNHIRISKEDYLPDWARWDKQVKKCDRVDHEILTLARQKS